MVDLLGAHLHTLLFLLSWGHLLGRFLSSSFAFGGVRKFLTHYVWHYALPFLLRAEMAAAFFLASALDEAPHARSESSKRVGLPLESRSGPRMPPIRARKLARRGLSPDLTGAFSLPPL